MADGVIRPHAKPSAELHPALRSVGTFWVIRLDKVNDEIVRHVLGGRHQVVGQIRVGKFTLALLEVLRQRVTDSLGNAPSTCPAAVVGLMILPESCTATCLVTRVSPVKEFILTSLT